MSIDTGLDTNNIYFCRRCGKKLKNLNSIKNGLGPICYKKWQAESHRKPLFPTHSLQTRDKDV